MALPEIKEIELTLLDNWFSNLIDTLNFDLGQVTGQIPALDAIITNIDSAPIKYLKDSLDDLVSSLNESFKQIDERLSKIEGQQQSQQAPTKQGGL